MQNPVRLLRTESNASAKRVMPASEASSGDWNHGRPTLRSSVSSRAPTAIVSSNTDVPSIGVPAAISARPARPRISMMTSRPSGRLIANTHRQEARSVMIPPSSGPRMGPTIRAAPHSAMTRPCRSGGCMSSSMACANGAMIPAPAPCRMRRAIMIGAEGARAHSNEAAMNAPTPAGKRRAAP